MSHLPGEKLGSARGRGASRGHHAASPFCHEGRQTPLTLQEMKTCRETSRRAREIDSQAQKINSWLPEGKGGRGNLGVWG